MPERLARHRGAAASDEYRIGGPLLQNLRPRFLEIALEPAQGFLAERDQPLLRALAYDTHHAHVLTDLRDFQCHKLGDAQPACIKSFQHRTAVSYTHLPSPRDS